MSDTLTLAAPMTPERRANIIRRARACDGPGITGIADGLSAIADRRLLLQEMDRILLVVQDDLRGLLPGYYAYGDNELGDARDLARQAARELRHTLLLTAERIGVTLAA